jgi:hypothetical protein
VIILPAGSAEKLPKTLVAASSGLVNFVGVVPFSVGFFLHPADAKPKRKATPTNNRSHPYSLHNKWHFFHLLFVFIINPIYLFVYEKILIISKKKSQEFEQFFDPLSDKGKKAVKIKIFAFLSKKSNFFQDFLEST